MNILKSNFSFLLLLGILCLASCAEEDPCENVACQNGGVIDETPNGCGCDCSGTLYTGLACSEFDPDEIQALLDDGITPKELLDGGITEDLLYGKMYQGGLIFYINPDDGTGMVAATEDQSDGYTWGCIFTFIGIHYSDDRFGAGAINTRKILEECSEISAAKLCDELQMNGYNDWFLPSFIELSAMAARLADADGDGRNNGLDDPGNIGGFAREIYWSSTEYDPDGIGDNKVLTRAFTIDLNTEFGDAHYKDEDTFSVRAARAF